MFTLVGFQESVDEASAIAALAACTDPHVTVVGDLIYVPKLNKMLAEFVQGSATSLQAQIRTPSLRARTLHEVIPISNQATTPLPRVLNAHFGNPIELVEGEGLEFLHNQSTAVAAVKTGLVWLGDGPAVPVGGDIFSVRVTATITSVLARWVAGALTFDQTLPRGRYAVVGAQFWEADLLAVRFVPIGEFWRPGVLGSTSMAVAHEQLFRNGNLGVFFEFDSLTPPQIEILNFAAAAQTITGVLDLLKLG